MLCFSLKTPFAFEISDGVTENVFQRTQFDPQTVPASVVETGHWTGSVKLLGWHLVLGTNLLDFCQYICPGPGLVDPKVPARGVWALKAGHMQPSQVLHVDDGH